MVSAASVLLALAILAGVTWQHLDNEGRDYRATLKAYAGLEVLGHALERFRQREGQYPAHLGELVAADIEKLPLDPFAQGPHPFQYRTSGRLNERRVLYSVGPDREDNAGAARDLVTGRGDLLYPVE